MLQIEGIQAGSSGKSRGGDEAVRNTDPGGQMVRRQKPKGLGKFRRVGPRDVANAKEPLGLLKLDRVPATHEEFHRRDTGDSKVFCLKTGKPVFCRDRASKTVD